jgi:A/G-specific adenine glycosylase
MSERHQGIRTSTGALSREFRRADAQRLLAWARRSSRSFPWRRETDPYRLAITELMLVRTRADQVANIWEGFFAKFPTLASLVDGDPLEVETALKPLGLRWRSRRVLEFARAASARTDWICHAEDLPGAGPYVLAAVRVGASGAGTLPVDVTIARVLARFFGLAVTGEARRNTQVLDAATSMGERSRSYFHAWLDLAALVCIPRQPACSECPLQRGCRTATAARQVRADRRGCTPTRATRGSSDAAT